MMRHPRILLLGLMFGTALVTGLATPRLPALDLWPPFWREPLPELAPEPPANTAEPSPFQATINATLKGATQLASNGQDALLYPQRNTATGLFRLRFHLVAHYGTDWTGEVDYEHQAALTSYDYKTVPGAGASRGSNRLAYRVTALRDRIVDEDRVLYVHEIDRLLIAWRPAWGKIQVGRQALGFGRGVLFSAVDLFSPFAPLAVDREWRPGVDAAVVEAHLSDTTSGEALLVGGRDWAESAGLVRLRGYFGRFDAELLAGVRSQDNLAGLSVSSVVGDAEMHGEAAAFRMLRAHPDGEPFGDDRLAVKALLGGSYNFNIGDGVTVVGEYLYSGLGAKDSRRIQELLSRPEYQQRQQRGEMQILSRHAFGVQVTYPIDPTVIGTANVVIGAQDGSGIFSPALRWDPSDGVSVIFSATLPWGRGSKLGNLRSEYGSTPRTVFAQIAWYL